MVALYGLYARRSGKVPALPYVSLAVSLGLIVPTLPP
jgi:hypothetical protein